MHRKKSSQQIDLFLFIAASAKEDRARNGTVSVAAIPANICMKKLKIFHLGNGGICIGRTIQC
jgi:hypothetical protein